MGGEIRPHVTSVAITAAAALAVALIAAITAQQRQKAQLAAEGDRLDATLESERERQRAAFVHDRQLHDLSELRTVLDDAATRLDKLRTGLEAAEMTLVASAFHPGARESPPHPDYERDHPEPWDEVYRRLRDIYQQTEDLSALVPRLRIRFPEHEPVVGLYEQATAVARRHPFSVDFVEEGASLESAGRRLAEISAALGSIRAQWDSRAITLARFNVTASDGDHADHSYASRMSRPEGER